MGEEIMMEELSNDVANVVGAVKDRLVHIGGKGIPGRTGVVWGKGLVVTLARQAADGEAVEVVLPSGERAEATVRAYDRLTGLTVLNVPQVGADWVPGELPRVGELVVTVAFASAAGVESKLESVRFVSGRTTWGSGIEIDHCFQTSGPAFPGFTGAAVVDAKGRFVGFVASNRDGNEGFVVPVFEFRSAVEALATRGSRKKAYLGIQTQGVRLSGEQATIAGSETALLVTDVAAGSPAQKAQWKVADVVVSWNSNALRHPHDLYVLLQSAEVETPVPVVVLRGGEKIETTIVPEGR